MTSVATPKERLGGAVVSTVPDDRTLLPGDPVTSVNRYLESGGGSALVKALSLPRTEILDVVAHAGLRGRGGGGFPAAEAFRRRTSGAVCFATRRA